MDEILSGIATIVKDDKQGIAYTNIVLDNDFQFYIGHSQMFCLIYEKAEVDSDSLEPHLWSYHQKISLEHIGQTIQEK